jgi:hypothetical protein
MTSCIIFTMSENTPEPSPMSPEQKRRDQLLRAEHSTEVDAAPRIEVSEHDGNVRIDVAETAAVRPGPGPGVEGAEEADGGGGTPTS